MPPHVQGQPLPAAPLAALPGQALPSPVTSMPGGVATPAASLLSSPGNASLAAGTAAASPTPAKRAVPKRKRPAKGGFGVA